MSLVVTSLPDYTRDNATILLMRSLYDAKTQRLIEAEGNIQIGIKNEDAITDVDTDVVFQDGSVCGFNSSGTTALSQRKIKVGVIAVQESLCPKQLDKKYLSSEMQQGSNPQAIPFEKEYTELKARKIAKANEVAIWQGDTASGNVNLNKYDGLIKIIDAANDVVRSNSRTGTGTITAGTGAATVTGVSTVFDKQVKAGDKLYSGSTLIGVVQTVTSATAITLTGNAAVAVTAGAFNVVSKDSPFFAAPITAAIDESNVRSIVKGVWKSIPADVQGKDNVRVFAGWDTFNHFVGALIEANLYHISVGNETQQAGEILIAGTNYKLTAVHGLDGTGRLFGLAMKNLWLGTDLQGEEDKFEMTYAVEAKEVRFDANFKLGTQVSFPAEIVDYKKLA